MKTLVTIFMATAALALAGAKDTVSIKIQIDAIRLAEPITIDGKLSEPVWHNGSGFSQFIQRDPHEGGQPTQKTIVHLAYDDAAIYIGARMFDSAPDSIIARLGRRDAQLTSDMFGFFVDPYYDRRSGFYFSINAAGTMYDGVLYNDEWDDDSWDGVWEAEVQIDAQGWTAEMRIPYSQLRFKNKDRMIWGINFRRDIARKNERDYLVFTPKNGSGFVSRFADLVGIENITPPRRVEVLPYVTTKAEYTQHLPGNPFNDGSKYLPGSGADLKVGIGSNLTLDATVNPDFGQVEVDPAVVNLGDVETFFSEKRPFFIEGSTIFNFGQGGSRSNWGFNWSSPQFFYTRRIGRAPQGSAPSADFADVPLGTNILGAAKLTGKIGGNWNIGTLHALTSREHAELKLTQDNRRWHSEVEPLSYYGIARAQKEIKEGRQGIGFISTLAARRFDDQRLRDEINSSAFTGGVDGWTFLDANKTWVLTGWAGMSQLRGNEARLTALQRSSRHYFQRPDAGHVEVDSFATSLTGYAGRLLLNKQKGNVIFNSAIGFVDPKFDLNDMGFLFRTDVINGHIGGGYKWTKLGRFTRYRELLGAVFGSRDFDGNMIWMGVWQSGYFEFLNYYSFNYSFAYNPETVNNNRTRGGPLTLNRPGWQANFFLNSDSRKTWVFGLGTFGYSRGPQNWDGGFDASVEWKPSANLSVSTGPTLWWNRNFAQYVTVIPDPQATATFGNRYIFAALKQTELSASIRMDWTFTPRLSLQLYAQPLISSGDYFSYKELTRPRSYEFTPYLTDRSDDFNFKSLRGNAVLRWEYSPGSTLYFVWTQSRTDYENFGDFRFNRSVNRLTDARPDNIFLIKASYWLGL